MFDNCHASIPPCPNPNPLTHPNSGLGLLDADHVGPCIVILCGFDKSESKVDTPLIVMPSTWGTVSHYQRLAHSMPTVTWGIEHGYVRTGDTTFMRASTIEEQADEYAKTIGLACHRFVRGRRFHTLGGSVGALM